MVPEPKPNKVPVPAPLVTLPPTEMLLSLRPTTVGALALASARPVTVVAAAVVEA